MAMCFGNPITNSTLEAMLEYEGKTMTRWDRAHMAFNMKNDQDKDNNARQYVEMLKLQEDYNICTLCLIYNAVGDTITFVCHNNWCRHLGPGRCPIEIASGQ